VSASRGRRRRERCRGSALAAKLLIGMKINAIGQRDNMTCKSRVAAAHVGLNMVVEDAARVTVTVAQHITTVSVSCTCTPTADTELSILIYACHAVLWALEPSC